MAAVAEDGTLYTWGGYSAHAHRHSPTLGHAPNEVRLQESLGGTPSLSTPTAVAALAHVQVAQVDCGPEHAAAITREGKLYCWGSGERGRLGTGTQVSVARPMASSSHANATAAYNSVAAAASFELGLREKYRTGLRDSHWVVASTTAATSSTPGCHSQSLRCRTGESARSPAGLSIRWR